jgi:aldehyde:ferredoxin oxidoreductase
MAENVLGTNNKILEINLSTGENRIVKISNEDRKMYLGGKGLGLKLLSERLKPGTDPLSPDNVLIINTGLYLSSGVPCSARFNAVTKSPLTEIIVSSSCGGPFGMALKTAGYDGLILFGKAEKPCIIEIKDKLEIKDAGTLWGQNTFETQESLNLPKAAGAVVIGPAGENKVLYACAVSGHRFLGRGGIGAVMGSKNVKAIVAHGKKFKINPVDKPSLDKLKKRGTKYINQNEVTSINYRKYGTNSHVLKCNDSGMLPVRNFTDGSHPEAEKISGELYAEKYTKKYSTCKPCTILCGHAGEFSGQMMQIPEYESTGLLGPNIEIFDPELIAKWNDTCGKVGIDTITAGGVLAWAMEATEKGLIESDLKFGKGDNIEQVIYDIANRKGLGNELANGTRKLAEKFGGIEFAMQVKGMELAAYDPRGAWGQGLSYAVANRGGCHLSAPVFSMEGLLHYLKPHTTIAKAVYTDYFENMYATVNSMHACQFTSFAYMLEPFVVKNTPKFLLKLTMQYLPKVALALMDISVYSKSFEAITGIKLSQKQMLLTGKRIHLLERHLNTLEGIDKKVDTLPARLLNEGRTSDKKQHVVPLDKMLRSYYRIKGYDKNGIPKKSVLKNVGIELLN